MKGEHGSIGARAWLLLSRGLILGRKGAFALVCLAAVTPGLITGVSSTVASSASPGSGDLARRLLGPYDLRVQANDVAGAEILARLARDFGGSAAPVVTTPAMVLSSSSAASGTLEQGLVDPHLLGSRFDRVAGRLPSLENEVALSRPLAAAMGVGPGASVTIASERLMVSGVVLDRTNFTSRLIVRSARPASAPLGDPARTSVNVYVQAPASRTADLADQYLRQGLGLVSAARPVEDALGNDGELSRGLERLVWAAMALGSVALVLATGMMARILEPVTRTMWLLGFDSRRRSALVGWVVGAATLLSAAFGAIVGVALARAGRPRFEELDNARWYAVRVADIELAVVIIGLTVLSVGTAAWWIWRMNGEVTALREREAARVAWSRLALLLFVGGVLGSVVALTRGSPAFLLGTVVLIAPALGIAGAKLTTQVLLRGTNSSRTVPGLLLRTTLRDRSELLSVAAAALATLIVFPIAGSLVVSGLSSGYSIGAVVPRADLAIYTASTQFSTTELNSVADEGGARSVRIWNLATLPAGRSGSASREWIPVAATSSMVSCPRNGQGAASVKAERACSAALRGIGLTTPATLTTLLGRDLTPKESASFARGVALMMGPVAPVDGQVELAPLSWMGDPKVGAVTVEAVIVVPAAGTAVSERLPSVWLDAGAAASRGIGSGQVQAAFEFMDPVTPRTESRLRRALVMRSEVSDGEEFLVTHLDATRVSLIQTLLRKGGWAVLLIGLGTAAALGLALRRAMLPATRVLYDLGLSRRDRARWFSSVLGLGGLLGVLCALSAGLVVGWLVVQLEVGHGPPGSGYVNLLPVLAAPVAAAAAGVAWAVPRPTSVWSEAFLRE